MRSRHVSRVIAASPQTVYDYARDPDHLPLWAAGLASSPATREGDALVVDSPLGRVSVRFVDRNDLGVLDHDVTLPSGAVVTNPMRVMAHPDGAEILFTVRQLEMTDEQFESDCAAVAGDLQSLGRLVDHRGRAG